MPTDLAKFFGAIWDILTEVPGWSDAPKRVRLRRLWPLAVPCLAMAGLVGWSALVRQPFREQVRAGHAHLLALEQQLADLRLRCSEQQATELAGQASAASAMLLDSADDAAAFFKGLRESLAAKGWESSSTIYDDTTEGEAPAGRGFGFVNALVRLTPQKPTPAPLEALLGALEQFSSSGKRIDLTRMVIRADEPGRPSVDVNVRIACCLSHEKIAE